MVHKLELPKYLATKALRHREMQLENNQKNLVPWCLARRSASRRRVLVANF